MNATISFFNSLSRKLETFSPLNNKRITMYVCGPTVYSYAHIGNARSAVAFDLLFRLLRQEYGANRVIYARNITDVDDKIIAASKESGESITELTERFTDIYLSDMDSLNVLRPNLQPKATEHIGEMIQLIERLIDNGHAYEGQGHVLFNTKSFNNYGALSKRNLEDMVAGARVEVAPYKQNPTDFVLWKPATNNEIGWDSPWGYGRPGWHIECSAMIANGLGSEIDIHGGGHDLTFPHHENELAQSCCGFNISQPVRYWLHNGFVNIDAEKMSKSLGNVVLAHDLLMDAPGEAIRLALINAHYRNPLNWSDKRLNEAKSILDSWYRIEEHYPSIKPTTIDSQVLNAMRDDLNSPLALSRIHHMANAINQSGDENLIGPFKASAQFLGLLNQDAGVWFKGGNESDSQKIDALVQQRQQARHDKDFARADAIRDELDEMGIVIEDGSDGAKWRKK